LNEIGDTDSRIASSSKNGVSSFVTNDMRRTLIMLISIELDHHAVALAPVIRAKPVRQSWHYAICNDVRIKPLAQKSAK